MTELNLAVFVKSKLLLVVIIVMLDVLELWRWHISFRLARFRLIQHLRFDSHLSDEVEALRL